MSDCSLGQAGGCNSGDLILTCTYTARQLQRRLSTSSHSIFSAKLCATASPPLPLPVPPPPEVSIPLTDDDRRRRRRRLLLRSLPNLQQRETGRRQQQSNSALSRSLRLCDLPGTPPTKCTEESERSHAGGFSQCPMLQRREVHHPGELYSPFPRCALGRAVGGLCP